MRQFAIIAILALTAGWCFAQSDSAKADSTQVTVEVQGGDGGPAAVTVTTEQRGTDTTLTVRVGGRGRPLGDVRRHGRWSRDWILGFEVNNLELKSFPGTMILQRKLSQRVFVGSGLTLYHHHDDPGEHSHPVDSTRYNSEGAYWSATMKPEIGYTVLSRGRFTGGLSLRASLTRSRQWSSVEDRDESYYYHYWSSYNESNQMTWGLAVPVFIEWRFHIRRMPLSVGIINDMVTVNGGWAKEKTKRTQQSWSFPNLEVTEDERTSRLPTSLFFRNPFQEYVRAYVKFYI